MALLNAFNLHKGFGGWVLQRVSAVFLSIYVAIILFFWLVYTEYGVVSVWKPFLLSVNMRILGVLSAISLMVHATIGAWVVVTDYIHFNGVRWCVLTFFYFVTIASSLAALYLLIGV